MGQRNFRVKFSLGAKLVLSLILLFLSVVSFLSYSAVKLVIEDKRAYTFQLQSLGAYVAGQNFGEKTRPVLDGLRLYLTAFDPRTSIDPVQEKGLSALVKNQRDIGAVLAYLLPQDGSAIELTKHENPEALSRIGVSLASVRLDRAFFLRIREDLLRRGYAMEGYFRPGVPPLLILAFADVGLKNYPKGMPVALAVIDARNLIEKRGVGETVVLSEKGTLLTSSNPKHFESSPDFTLNPAFSGALESNLSSGTREYAISGVDFLGAYAKLSTGPIVLTQLEKRQAMAAAFTLGERLVLLGVISLVVAILFAVVFSGSITKPLRRLTWATAQVAQGNFDVDPQVRTRDEVGALASSFSVMSQRIQSLIVEQVKKAHMQEELKVAAAVQESLIPAPAYSDDRIELYGSYQPAAECGGDWWGFFRHENKVCLMVADATGHGVPSALITASARSCFSVLAKWARENPDFRLSSGEMMSYANRVVFDAATTKIMMTAFIGVVDLDKGTLTYANAGHNPPWLFQKNETGFKLKSLVAKGQRLGETEESGVYDEVTVPIGAGDLLLLYTDGLMENTGPDGNQYGKKRAKNVAEAALGLGPQGVLEALKSDSEVFNGIEKPLDDDLTLVAFRML
jgi:serine phosphatase RsbU (regulator of sigma subunit)